MNNLLVWFKKWKIKFKSVKSAERCLTNQRSNPVINLNLKLNDEPFPWKTKYKYLDIHLDSKLSRWQRITEILDRANRYVGSFKLNFRLGKAPC